MRLFHCVLALAACALEPSSPTQDWPQVDFDPMQGAPSLADVTTDRLCAESEDPNNPEDPIFIDCRVETARLATDRPAATDTITILTWNLERGHDVEGQIDALAQLATSGVAPDIVLVSEADRGCERTGYRHVAGDIAQALNMDMAYATEFLEVGHDGSDWTTCEHGNAILSRFELGNVGAFRHTDNVSWYTPLENRGSDTDGTRLGGRIAVTADVRVGEKVIRLYSVHFASGATDDSVRGAQAAETADHGAQWAAPALIGGDMNAGAYVLDLARGTEVDGVTTALLSRGWYDSHAPLPLDQRITQSVLILDLLFAERDWFDNPGICPEEICGHLSDHLAIWTDVDLQ